GDEEKWAEKAVDSLVKKLKKKQGKNAISELEKALSNPTQPSGCVTIPRSLDGRLQVAHKKNLPHVIYCKVWRWPDLMSHHELKALDCCKYPYNSKQKEVCINPYHYRRVEITGMIGGRYPDSDYMTPAKNFQSVTSMSQLSLNLNIPHAGSVSPQELYSPTRSFLSNESPSPGITIDDFNEYGWGSNQQQGNEPKEWCSVSYYELNNKIGETKRISSSSVQIDGFSDASETVGRVCLGLISNVNRNSTVEKTRRSIGEGLSLTRDEVDGFVVIRLRCLSQNPIFVQSRSFNVSHDYGLTTVCKVPPGCRLDVYDDRILLKCIKEASQSPNKCVELFGLNNMCSIRLSFVKGWGEDYKRVDITSTPCWVEIFFYDALIKLDSVIRHETPSNAISSKS
uniref:Mothers against decapentaplegic homolog n=1 Tax=Romanomermis culicivorax TaxID=13658 RepID=A0A915HLT3_ROMCU